MSGVSLAIGILFGLVAWIIIVERRAYFSKKRKESREFAPRMAELLRENKLREGLKCAEGFPASHMAAVVGAGIQVLVAEILTEDKASTVKRIQRAMERESQTETAKIKRSLPFLEALGAVSPAVALLYSHEAAIYLGLVATAPSVGQGILFRGTISRLEIEMSNSQSEVLDFCEKLLETSLGNRQKLLNKL